MCFVATEGNDFRSLDLCCVAKEGMQMDIECVLFCNVRKSRKMLDVGCVAREEMP